MKRNIPLLKIAATAAGIAAASACLAQEHITESEYLRRDSLLWSRYTLEEERMAQLWEKMPEKRDSIQQAFDRLFEESSRENIELAKRYASVPSGLQRLYMVRLDLPKDTLAAILDSLEPEMRQSPYGQNIREHIRSEQIEPGAPIFRFSCLQHNGEPFDWSVTDRKQLLLLYGGLGCMGESGREYLKQLYERTSRKEFLIIVYWPCSSLEELQGLKKEYPGEYLFVSDFKQDASPMKIKYGTQATPTCFLTDAGHTVLIKCTGLRPNLFDPLIPNTSGQ